MRNDQIFVLLLVVLLPLTGCFDGGGIGDAEAQDTSSGDDSSSADTVVTMPAVMTISINEGQTQTITLNGTTLLLETVHKQDGSGYWRTNQYSVEMSMTCDNGFSMDRFWLGGGNNEYLPNLPNVECDIEMNTQPANSETPQTATILTFSEAILSGIE